MELEFSELTINITKQLSKETKKKEGIFITPLRIIQKLHGLLISLPCIDFSCVLEPSCGTCEFVQFLDKNHEGIVLDAVEKNEVIYTGVHQQIIFTEKNRVQLFHHQIKNILLLLVIHPLLYVQQKKFQKNINTLLLVVPICFLYLFFTPIIFWKKQVYWLL